MKKENINRIYQYISRHNFICLSALIVGILFLGNIHPLKAQQPAEKKYAKSVIFVYLDGGPAQTDMFDPKPKAGKDYTGPLVKTSVTNVPGI